MARTYGEVLESSFSAIFSFAAGDRTVFVDIGSGHGKITIDAVRMYGCRIGIGIEKYREPAAVCQANLAELPADMQTRLRFKLEDISDTDLIEELADADFHQLLIFCNNLAFSQGTVSRLARKIRDVMDRLATKEVIMISTVPLPPLEDRFAKHVLLGMSWTNKLHESCVYMSRPAA